jgi:hypothetical protein
VREKEAKGAPPNQTSVEQKIKTQDTMSLNERRAVVLLITLFDKAKELEDAEIKVWAETQIADALWEYDAERARQQFIEAFRTVDMLKDPEQKGQAGVASLLQSSKFGLQREILRMVWHRDSALAESLLQSINEGKSQGAKGGSIEQAAQHMFLAAEVAKSNTERASQMAAEIIKGGIDPTIGRLLTQIKQRDPVLANKVFAQALAAAQTRPAAAIDNIGNLIGFVLPTEQEYMLGNTAPTPERRAAIELFLNFAYNSLLQKVALEIQARDRLSKPADQARQRDEFFVLGETLALFDQYRPEQGGELRARLSSVMARVPPRKPSGPGIPPQDIEELLDRAKSQGNPVQKDRLYIQAAMQAAREGDVDRALSIVNRIDNREDRFSVESVIRFQAAHKALEKEGPDAAYKYAKDIGFIPQRVGAYRRIAQALLEKKDTARASELLNELEQWIGKADAGPDKAMGLLAIAGLAAGFDQPRGFEVMHSAVKALNAARFDLPQGHEGGAIVKRTPSTLKRVDFRPAFPQLAKADFDRALLLAQSLERKELTVLAQVAVCQGVLGNPPTPAEKGEKKPSN